MPQNTWFRLIKKQKTSHRLYLKLGNNCVLFGGLPEELKDSAADYT